MAAAEIRVAIVQSDPFPFDQMEELKYQHRTVEIQYRLLRNNSSVW